MTDPSDLPALAECCRREADRSLQKHRKVALCDGCGKLVLGYPDRADYDHTITELSDNGIAFQVGQSGKMRVIAYER